MSVYKGLGRSNIPSDRLVQDIFIESLRGDKLKIMCNYCTDPGHIFYEGTDTDAGDVDWLALAVLHLEGCKKL